MPTPRTIPFSDTPAPSISYKLAPGVFQYIESVLVEIDNTAGGDVKPELLVKTQNGVVMATKQQGRSIPAGDTGSATWALRLDDEKPDWSQLAFAYAYNNITPQFPVLAAGTDVKLVPYNYFLRTSTEVFDVPQDREHPIVARRAGFYFVRSVVSWPLNGGAGIYEKSHRTIGPGSTPVLPVDGVSNHPPNDRTTTESTYVVALAPPAQGWFSPVLTEVKKTSPGTVQPLEAFVSVAFLADWKFFDVIP